MFGVLVSLVCLGPVSPFTIVSFSVYSHTNILTRSHTPLHTSSFFVRRPLLQSCLVSSHSGLGIGRNRDRGLGHQNIY